MKTVMYYPFLCSSGELANVRKWASWWGYDIEAVAHSVEDLKKELVRIKSAQVLVWDLDDIDRKDGCVISFYELIQQFDVQIHDLSRRKLIVHAGEGTFVEKEAADGAMKIDGRPPRIFKNL